MSPGPSIAIGRANSPSPSRRIPALTWLIGRAMRKVKLAMRRIAVGISATISQKTLLRDFTACARSRSMPSSMTRSPRATSACARPARRGNSAARRIESSGEGGALDSIAWMASSALAMAADSARCASESGISSSERSVAANAARLARYASRKGASPATAYWRAVRSREATLAVSARLACVTLTAASTACSESAASFSNATAFAKSAKTSGAATIVKPSSSSDRKERG